MVPFVYFAYRSSTCIALFDPKDLTSYEPKLNTRNSIPGQTVHVCYVHLFLQAFSRGLPYETIIYKDGKFIKKAYLNFHFVDKNLDGWQHDYLVEMLDMDGKRLYLSYPSVVFPTQSQGNVGLDWSNGRPEGLDLSSYTRTRGFEKLKFVVRNNPYRSNGYVSDVGLSVDSDTGSITGLKIYGKSIAGHDLEPITFSGLENPFVYVKYDATFNENSFLWDDAFVSWFSLNLDPILVINTLDFWYSLQVQTGPNVGFIPREVRNSSYPGVTQEILDKEINPLSLHPLSSNQAFGPYLLSKVEIELYKKTKNIDRLENILPYQIHYFNWLESHRKSEKLISSLNQKCPIYSWSNLGSGMDNSPRGGGSAQEFGWFDLAAQQVSLAGDIHTIAAIVKDNVVAREYQRIHESLSADIHSCYYDKKSSWWFDMLPDGKLDTQNPTAAGFWGIYAGLASSQELSDIFDKWLYNPQRFGGIPPLPSLPRDHPLFSSDGQYWLGGAWPPLWWIVIYGLRESGLSDESRQLSQEVLAFMESVYQETGSVFEFYAPDPNTLGRHRAGIFNGGQARADFLGWGKLPLYLYEYWK